MSLRTKLSLSITIFILIIDFRVHPNEEWSSHELIEFPLGFLVLWGVLWFILNAIAETSEIRDLYNRLKSFINNKIKENESSDTLHRQTQESLEEYENTKSTLRYFSDEKLQLHYKIETEKGASPTLLALEEAMVERGLLSHSPMHEKMHLMNQLLNKK